MAEKKTAAKKVEEVEEVVEVVEEYDFPLETYPHSGFPQQVLTALEQFRQQYVMGDPLTVEWLADSLRDGKLHDLGDYIERYRPTRAAEAEAVSLDVEDPDAEAV